MDGQGTQPAEEHASTCTVEYLDVWTSDGIPTGRKKPRNHVHRDGDWHPCVHIWIYNPDDDTILIQRRVATKESWGGYLDVSCAGHIPAGEGIAQAGVRELEEELGLTVKQEELILLGMVPQCHILKNGKYIDNEFAFVYAYILKSRIPENEFKLQASEVENVEYMPLQQFIEVQAAGQAKEKLIVPLVDFDKYQPLLESMRQYAVKPQSQERQGTDDSKQPGSEDAVIAEEAGEDEDGWIQVRARKQSGESAGSSSGPTTRPEVKTCEQSNGSAAV